MGIRSDQECINPEIAREVRCQDYLKYWNYGIEKLHSELYRLYKTREKRIQCHRSIDAITDDNGQVDRDLLAKLFYYRQGEYWAETQRWSYLTALQLEREILARSICSREHLSSTGDKKKDMGEMISILVQYDIAVARGEEPEYEEDYDEEEGEGEQDHGEEEEEGEDYDMEEADDEEEEEVVVVEERKKALYVWSYKPELGRAIPYRY